MEKITYVFPTRQRRSKAFAALDNIHSLSEKDYFEILLVMDSDDSEMNNEEVVERLKSYPHVKPFYGTSTGKVNACNREIDKISSDTSIVCLHSDDMVYLQKGFDNDIREAFEKHFPSFDGIVHFPDTNARARVMTYTMMGINLLKQLEYLYHNDFLSVYCDNHLTEMCKAMGKYAFVNKPILNHYHPIWRMSEWDEQYKKNESDEFYQKDKATYLRLKENNFGIK